MAKNENRCWPGYEPVPGKKEHEQGSCRKKPKSRSTPKEQEVQEKRASELKAQRQKTAAKKRTATKSTARKAAARKRS